MLAGKNVLQINLVLFPTLWASGIDIVAFNQQTLSFVLQIEHESFLLFYVCVFVRFHPVLKALCHQPGAALAAVEYSGAILFMELLYYIRWAIPPFFMCNFSGHFLRFPSSQRAA